MKDSLRRKILSIIITILTAIATIFSVTPCMGVKRNVPALNEQRRHFRFVHPMRIELISSEPESGILSIELRVPP